MEEKHWDDITRICLACKEPAENDDGDDGGAVVTCPDCGCHHHADCIQEEEISSSWCLYCRLGQYTLVNFPKKFVCVWISVVEPEPPYLAVGEK